MGGLGRNEPCWCGSGKKFKKCHLNRESQKTQSIWDIQPRFWDIHKTKECLHPDSGDSTCGGGIVRAHTVRRSADLKPIARGGHVYQGKLDFALLNRTGGRIVPRLIGINEASTFWGFCNAHDSSTFAPLETEAFGPTREQAFLLAYRPLVKELYLKSRQLETLELTREADKGRSFEEQIGIQQFIYWHGQGVRSAIYDLTHHKTLFDADLLARDFSHIRYVAIHLDQCPDVMCSGMVQPAYAFDGRLIQDLAAIDIVLHEISFSLISTTSGGAAVFAWRDNSDSACEVLVDSLLSLPRSDIPSALVRFALSELENAFLRPTWWESLTDDERRVLEDRINHNVNPFVEADPRILCDDGLRAVDWGVTRIEQSRT